MSGDFELNSLRRFAKRSSRLVLEEPCEVPAGCGGVVFRWTNADDGLPAMLRAAHRGSDESLYLNGHFLPTSRTRLRFGSNVLAIHIEGLREQASNWLPLGTPRRVPGSEFDWFVFNGQHRTGNWSEGDSDAIEQLASAADGTWLVSLSQPAEDWTTAEFDDSGWQPMVASSMDLETVEERRRLRFEFAIRHDETPLALPAGVDAIWIRKRFQLAR